MPEELSVTNAVHHLQLVVMIVGVEVVAVITEVEGVVVMITIEVEVTTMIVAVVGVGMVMMVGMAEVVLMVVIKEGMMVVMDRVLRLLPHLMVVLVEVMHHLLMHMVGTPVMRLMQFLHPRAILGGLLHILHHMVLLLVTVVIILVIVVAVDEVVKLVGMVEVLETQEVMVVLQPRLLKKSSSVMKIVGIPVITREFIYQICLQMSLLRSLENFLEVLAKLQESNKSGATRINGPGASKYIPMNKETTKEMQFCLMKIHLLHILLVVFSICMI